MNEDRTEQDKLTTPAPAPAVAGFLGRCPRCGKGSIFKSFLSLGDRCPACGLDLSFADTGDGPAFFASSIGGAIVLGFGVWLQIAYEPAFWVYPLVFIPFGTIVCLTLVRICKGLLVALQYANKAGQGRFGP